MKGGYQIVDLQNANITDTATVIPGLYALIEGTRKQILLSNIQVSGTEYHDTFVNPSVSPNKFIFTTDLFIINIDNNDKVTMTAIS